MRICANLTIVTMRSCVRFVALCQVRNKVLCDLCLCRCCRLGKDGMKMTVCHVLFCDDFFVAILSLVSLPHLT